MFGLDSNLIMGLLVGLFLGFYLGNKEFRTKVNDMIFKKKAAKPDVPPTVHSDSEKKTGA